MWACGVAAAARAAATAPGLRLFVLGALGGVAGSWEALFFSKMVLCRNSLGTGTCGTGPRLAKSAPSCRVEQERGQPPAHRSHGHRSHATGVTPHSLCGTTYLRAYLRLYFYLDCRVSCRILRENSSWYKIYHSLARTPPPRAEGIPVAWFILVPASGACKCTILNIERPSVTDVSLTKSVKLLNSGVCIEIHSLPLSSCCPRVAKGRGWHRGQARQTLAMIRGQTGRYHPVQSTRVLCGIVRA